MVGIIRFNDENKSGKQPESQNQAKYSEFSERFQKMADEELIKTFNCEVGVSGWVSCRAIFLSAMLDEFNRRKWDYKLIGDKSSLSLSKRVKLLNNKVEFER